jgi:hypothetical protein
MLFVFFLYKNNPKKKKEKRFSEINWIALQNESLHFFKSSPKIPPVDLYKS